MRPRTVFEKLARIDNWPKLAEDAHYCVSELTCLLDEEPKSLQRFFRRAFGKSVQEQLDLFRQLEVERLAKNGVQAKVIAARLHYKHMPQLSRQFKRLHGVSFRVWLKVASQSPQGFVPNG
jgi:AraC-like DNA-binding protein